MSIAAPTEYDTAHTFHVGQANLVQRFVQREHDKRDETNLRGTYAGDAAIHVGLDRLRTDRDQHK